MKQFVLTANVAYATGNDLLAVANGAVGFFVNKNGILTASSDGSDILREAMLVVGRPADKGGPIVIPVHTNKFSFTKGVYQKATTFEATFKVPAPKKIGDYSIIIAKKGVKFNERNKWTAMVHVRDLTMTNEALADKLAALINANSQNSGVSAVNATGTLTIKANDEGKDYQVLGADLLMDVKAEVANVGMPAYGDAKYVQDLANKDAADAGFEYTFRDAYMELYPEYPLNPLKANDKADTGFTIFNLRFAEPRNVKTRDEVVNQLVQVVFPTGSPAISTFEQVCNTMAGLL